MPCSKVIDDNLAWSTAKVCRGFDKSFVALSCSAQSRYQLQRIFAEDDKPRRSLLHCKSLWHAFRRKASCLWIVPARKSNISHSRHRCPERGGAYSKKTGFRTFRIGLRAPFTLAEAIRATRMQCSRHLRRQRQGQVGYDQVSGEHRVDWTFVCLPLARLESTVHQ